MMLSPHQMENVERGTASFLPRYDDVTLGGGSHGLFERRIAVALGRAAADHSADRLVLAPLERFPLDLNREDYRGSLGRANQIRFLGPQRRGCAMAKGYSKDLRERVVAIVEEGDSAREAARLLNVGASTAIRWIERWTTTGSVEAKPGTGHSRSPLNKHEQWLLDLIAEEPDLTLDDIRLRLSGAKKLKVGTSSIWRFYDRQEITFKKNSARRRAGSS